MFDQYQSGRAGVIYMISIIIPIYNEEKLLKEKYLYFAYLGGFAELIFVDGNSTDSSEHVIPLNGKLVKTKRNRAIQMNLGAKEAENDVLLFLHADTAISLDTIKAVEQALEFKQYVGGCLCHTINQPGLLFRWIAFTGNVRARLTGIYYGDQGIFVKKDVFKRIGGFPKTNLAEDVLFSLKLKKEGEIKMLSNKIYCSARRWEKQGILKTFAVNLRISLCLLFGQNLDRFARCYADVR